MRGLFSILRALKHRLSGEDPVVRNRKLGAKIGERVGIERDVIFDYSHASLIEVGDDVGFAPRVHLIAHDASTCRLLGYTRIGKVKIGNRVFLGAGTIVLPGVVIGDDVVIGAGSVVSRDIPSDSVAVGNPAKVVCSLHEYVERKKKEFETLPHFGHEYRAESDLTGEKRAEMESAMSGRFGYII